MAVLICGSLAFDTIMTFEGRFADQILAEQLHILNVSFLVPSLRRDFGGCAGNIAYSLNLLGHYTISEAFEPFIEAKYVRTKSLRQGSPAFFQGSTIGFGVDLRERPRFDNPFLSDATRTAIT